MAVVSDNPCDRQQESVVRVERLRDLDRVSSGRNVVKGKLGEEERIRDLFGQAVGKHARQERGTGGSQGSERALAAVGVGRASGNRRREASQDGDAGQLGLRKLISCLLIEDRFMNTLSID